jgi:hypothetical protein
MFYLVLLILLVLNVNTNIVIPVYLWIITGGFMLIETMYRLVSAGRNSITFSKSERDKLAEEVSKIIKEN